MQNRRARFAIERMLRAVAAPNSPNTSDSNVGFCCSYDAAFSGNTVAHPCGTGPLMSRVFDILFNDSIQLGTISIT